MKISANAVSVAAPSRVLRLKQLYESVSEVRKYSFVQAAADLGRFSRRVSVCSWGFLFRFCWVDFIHRGSRSYYL